MAPRQDEGQAFHLWFCASLPICLWALDSASHSPHASFWGFFLTTRATYRRWSFQGQSLQKNVQKRPRCNSKSSMSVSRLRFRFCPRCRQSSFCTVSAAVPRSRLDKHECQHAYIYSGVDATFFNSSHLMSIIFLFDIFNIYKMQEIINKCFDTGFVI